MLMYSITFELTYCTIVSIIIQYSISSLAQIKKSAIAAPFHQGFCMPGASRTFIDDWSDPPQYVFTNASSETRA